MTDGRIVVPVHSKVSNVKKIHYVCTTCTYYIQGPYIHMSTVGL